MKAPVKIRFYAKGVADFGSFLEEWPARTRAVRVQLPYLAADWVRRDMLRLLPNGDALRGYRQALEVARVFGAPGTFVTRVDPKHRKVRKVEVPRTVLYVRQKSKMRRARADIAVLEKYGPWTYASIPFVPPSSQAVLVSRRASKKEVQVIEKRNRKARLKSEVSRLLTRAGRREIRKNPLKIPKTVSKLPDVVFEALRMEFALGGGKAKPHWKPAIRHLMRSGLKQILRSNRSLTYALTRAKFHGWKRWPTRIRPLVRVKEARKFVPFQKRLGIRA